MTIERIEKIAQDVLKKSGITSVPVQVESIAFKHGIRISRGPNKDFSGILIRKNELALIGVNSTEASVRQRFTIAHELGHFFIHENKDTFIDYRDNKTGTTHSPREREANMFAAALLMPRHLIKTDHKFFANQGMFTEQEVEKMAEKYDVSAEAMKLRLLNLHLS